MYTFYSSLWDHISLDRQLLLKAVVKVKNNFEWLPEAVDGASSLANFAVDSWTVLIAEKDRCVSLPCSYKQHAKHQRYDE